MLPPSRPSPPAHSPSPVDRSQCNSAGRHSSLAAEDHLPLFLDDQLQVFDLFLVQHKAPEVSNQIGIAASLEVHDEHLGFSTSGGTLAALWLMVNCVTRQDVR